MKITFVAAPLTARSGVYRSARELVAEGRSQGHEWNLLLGVSSKAAGTAPDDDPEWISEFVREPSGLSGVRSLAAHLAAHPWVRGSDVVVSLIPQVDMALALTKIPWVAYTRGLPWPDKGEAGTSRRLVWRSLERVALGRARAIWATTHVLKKDLDLGDSVLIVPAGIKPIARTWDGRGERRRAVWAARYDDDKNPYLLIEAVTGTDIEATMYGSGRLQARLAAHAPPNVTVAGWTTPSRLWTGAFAYVGTSHREAFGRSAVEAAMSGIPVVLSKSFGCGTLLVTDQDFRRRFILDTQDPADWAEALNSLRDDEDLRSAYSDHLVLNAARLTIAASVRVVDASLEGLLSGS